MRFNDITDLGDWKGYYVSEYTKNEHPAPNITIHLKPEKSASTTCPVCGKTTTKIHETTVRRVRDLPLFNRFVTLEIERRRIRCSCGSTFMECLTWLDKRASATKRLVRAVSGLAEHLPIKHVATHYGLKWDAVKRIDKAYLKAKLGSVDVSKLERLAIDEFALHRGHRYATVVIDYDDGEVLWIGKGRSRKDIEPFFELLGEDGCQRIKAVAMDMNASYYLEFQKRCPQAAIVYDLFHVIAKYGREVIDRVRVDEANRLRSDRVQRKIIKGSKWILLANKESLVEDRDRIRLSELLKANVALSKAYVLRDDLKTLWSLADETEARTFWTEWFTRATNSRVEPLRLFAHRLAPYIEGIIAHSRFPMHTGRLEGINNTIKVIKRRAYGYRDSDYFFLKIRQAFPAKPG